MLSLVSSFFSSTSKDSGWGYLILAIKRRTKVKIAGIPRTKKQGLIKILNSKVNPFKK